MSKLRFSISSLPLRIFFPAVFLSASIILSSVNAFFVPRHIETEIENDSLLYVRKIMHLLQSIGEQNYSQDRSIIFQSLISSLLPENHIETLLIIDSKNQILAAMDSRFTGRSVDFFLENQRSSLKKQLTAIQSEKLLNGQIVLSEDKSAIFAAFPLLTPAPENPSLIFMEYDLSLMKDKEYKYILMLIVISTLLLILFSVLVTALFSKSLSSRLMSIISVTEKFGDGDLNARVLLSGRDEITTLGRAFNRMAERIRSLAMTDHLTGILNRRSFEIEVSSAIEKILNAEKKVKAAILYADLDGFKEINDSLGHSAGDILLKEFSARLPLNLTADSIIGRIGGDEFLLFVPYSGSRSEIEKLAFDLIQEGSRPYTIGGGFYKVTLSLGIALLPDDGQDINELLRKADTALQHAKYSGKNQYQFCTLELLAGKQRLKHLLTELKNSISTEGFGIAYQTIHDAKTKEISGVEALLRWVHPDFPNISPDEFVPVLVEAGLIREVGNWVLRKALTDFKEIKNSGLQKYHDFTISVNISAQELSIPDYAENILEVLRERDIPSLNLVLEITETEILKDPAVTLNALTRLRGAGVRIAIDDFGTGYSSLSYLRTLPADHLKLDRSFVMDLDVDKKLEAIAGSVIQMANALHLKVIAEGVETENSVRVLSSMGYDFLQGYHLGRPISLKDLLQKMQKNQP